MTHLHRSSSYLYIVTALCVLVEGCAVLTVDVDVYKGPLANHQDVQREQTAVTALAAKPLLGKLRYILEAYRRLGVIDRARRDFSEALRNSDAFLSPFDSGLNYINTPVWEKFRPLRQDQSAKEQKQFQFMSAEAAFVNRVLAEYDTDEESRLLIPFSEDQQRIKEEIRNKEKTAAVGYQELKSRLAIFKADNLTLRQKVRNSDDENTYSHFIARSRLGPGLESMIAAYSAANDAEQIRDPDQHSDVHVFTPEEDQLNDALIHFAQKILFLANQDGLFAEHIGLVPTFRGLGDIIVDGGVGPFHSRTAFTRVLQSVGNSILVNLDELRVRADYDRKIVDAAGREREAVRLSAGREPVAVFRDLITSLNDQVAELEKRSPLNGKRLENALLDAASHADSDRKTLEAASQSTEQAQQALDAAKTDITATVAKKAAAQAALQKATTAQTVADAAAKSSAKALAELTDAKRLTADVQVIEPHASEIVASGVTERISPLAALDRLQVALREDLKIESDKGAGADQDKLKSLADAIKLVATQPAPVKEFPGIETAHDAKEVMDFVIAALRQEQIQAVHDGGSDSPVAAHLNDALELAFAQRASMAYLRPASSYLRTSTPTTSLQRDARIGFKNLLGEHMFHQIPGADLVANGPDLETVLELDKQYWHNINTVRVAGGGDTNYVVAKDDVGNWYVKNYSADPKDIIKSAQGLALFALGPTASVTSLASKAIVQDVAAKVASGDPKAQKEATAEANNLKSLTGGVDGLTNGGTATPSESLDKVTSYTHAATTQSTSQGLLGTTGTSQSTTTTDTNSTASTKPATSGGATDAQSLSILNKELTAASSLYSQKSTDQWTSVQVDIQGLQAAVQTAWSNDPAVSSFSQSLTTPLTAAGAFLKLDADKEKKKTTDSDRTADALDAMMLFFNSLQPQIQPALMNAKSATADGSSAGADNVKSATADLIRVVRAAELKTLTPHQQDLQQYQIALDIIQKAQAQ